MIRGIIFDVDDTIYSHKNKCVPAATYKALKMLKEGGYKLCLCTSRFPTELYSLPKDMFSYFDYFILGTGVFISSKEGLTDIIELDKKVVREFIEYFEKNQIPYLWVSTDGQFHYAITPSEHIQQHHLDWTGKIPIVRKWNEEPIVNISFYDVDELQKVQILNIGKECAFEFWGHSGQINPHNVNKAMGLKKFAQHCNLACNEIAAFGDGANDISMINSAKVGIAVGNSNYELQKYADYISDPIEEGGIYTACIKYGWIQPESNAIEIVFFDIDGTTYQNNIHDVPKSTRLALKKLKERGFKLVICTSRAYQEMIELPKDFLDFMDAIICLGGAEIHIKDEVFYRYLNPYQTKRAMQYFDEHNIIYRYVDDQGGCYLNKSDPDINQIFSRLYNMIPKAKAYEDERIISMLFYSNDDQQCDEIEEILSLNTVTRLNFANEVTPQNMDKAKAIEVVAHHFGYSLENTAAFGDGINDITMLQTAKIGVAMGNASTYVKSAADYITDNIEDNGIFNACIQFGWISKEI